MALNKQMILNELGSVMNKLQSADCGCMGKLFSNQGQYSNQGGQGAANMCSPLPTCGGCRRGHCQGYGYGCGGQSHGYSAPSVNEPSNTHTPCMDMQCNPHKLQNMDPYAQQYQHQQNMDLTAQGMSPPELPSTYDGQINNANPTTLNQQPLLNSHPTQDQVLKEPIFPVDTSWNQSPPQVKYQKQYEYKTLEQPVEMLPARFYHPVSDSNPQQTLSPQPITKMSTDQSRFNVKNTASKTSLMAIKPVGRTISRGQLQHIYNQYKGSHSYTQQNIRSPGQGATFSEGRINVAPTPHHRHVPVERIAGDTLVNNQMVNNPIPVKGRLMGHLGDVPADNKPHGDIAHEGQMKKTRNGLQDLVYTSYPTSAAWSFHGNNQRSSAYPSIGYRHRA